MTWTDERIDQLTELWGAGQSATQIGKVLGMSKNAVIGKAHRLKLPARPSPIRKEGSATRPKPRAVPRLRPTPAPAPEPTPVPAATPRSVEAAKVRSVLEVVPRIVQRPARRANGGPGCLWPIGDPGDADFHFCGDASVPGKPYCDQHCAKAYIVKSRQNPSRAA